MAIRQPESAWCVTLAVAALVPSAVFLPDVSETTESGAASVAFAAIVGELEPAPVKRTELPAPTLIVGVAEGEPCGAPAVRVAEIDGADDAAAAAMDAPVA